MRCAKRTLKKYEILRGHAAYERLLKEGERVRDRGVTLFFCLPWTAGRGLVHSFQSVSLALRWEETMRGDA